MPISKKRLAEIAAIADEDIDTSDIPEAGEEFFKKAKLTVPSRCCACQEERADVVSGPTSRIRRTGRLGHLRPQRQLDQGQRPRHAADAGARLREARRAIPSDQVAAGLGQEPRADVHRPRQARTTRDSSRRSSSCRRRAIGASFHDEPLSQVRLLGGLDASSRNGTSATRPARTTAARSIRSARFWKATTRCWSAPMPPSASPWTSSGSRRSTTG